MLRTDFNGYKEFEKKLIAEALLSGLRYTIKSEVINDNITEAAGRELYKEFKNK